MIKKVERKIGDKILSIEAGKVAKQADGAVMVRYGDTVVLVTAVASDKVREGVDFLPLTVDYQEMAYAAGKIPRGFYKREGKPSDHEILTARFIDRPLRPLFPKGFFHETQIIATVLSAEQDNTQDILAITGASAALEISDIPFEGPVAGLRVARVDGEYIVNPKPSQLENQSLSLIVAGTRDAVVMVEGEGRMVPEEQLLGAIFFGHQALQPLLDMQEELKGEIGKSKRVFVAQELPAGLEKRVEELASEEIKALLHEPEKLQREKRRRDLSRTVTERLIEEYQCQEGTVQVLLEQLERRLGREMILRERVRIDGRSFTDLRPISCEVNVLPRTHGSGLFTRGETQVLAVTTLGTSSDEQRIDSLSEEEIYKSFILHYRFPPFCVGETKMLRGPSRREVGHGALAERAITPVLPPDDKFPYTIRIVAEVLESNGSSSMATTCSSILSLMDAGVPIKAPVAGIAMGLIKEGDEVVILTDILGDEDHFGDMDFKVAGTAIGVTAFQMDIKIKGVTQEILRRALQQAREGRLYILKKMMETIREPRESLSRYAPRIVTMHIKPEKIRDVIGPGGRVVRSISEETGVKIDIEDDGTIHLASPNEENTKKAMEIIKGLTEEAEIGAIYKGTVKRVMDFGAIVEIFPGTDGLVHISQLAPGHTDKVSDIVKEGDEILVKVLDIDPVGKIRLSRKAALGYPSDRPARDEKRRDRRGRSHPSRFNGQKNSPYERR